MKHGRILLLVPLVFALAAPPALAQRRGMRQAAPFTWRACAEAVRRAYQSAIEVHAHRR